MVPRGLKKYGYLHKVIENGVVLGDNSEFFSCV